jgi:parvulin-like peptidyl-prolyl isomerase
MRKFRIISSSTKPNSCNQYEFAPDTFFWLRLRAQPRGEDFGELAAAVSEDEASKTHGGDLGFFAASRMPAEFFEAAEQLLPNAPPRFLQSHLGFHALQVTDVHPARLLTLAEATPEISVLIAAEKRRRVVAALESELAQRTRFVVK